MALAPSRQFHPTATFFDSFHSSFSRFHGTPTRFFRYGFSISTKRYTFYASHSSITSNSIPEQHPLRKSNFYQPISSSSHRCSITSDSWIDKWSETHQHNRPKPPRALLNYRSGENGSVMNSGSAESEGNSGSSTMEKIVKKLKKFGYIDDVDGSKQKRQEMVIEKGSVEDIFYVEERMLPNSRGGFSAESPLGVESVFGGSGEVRFPWEKPKEEEEEEDKASVARKSRTSMAELTLPESELRRLRNLTFQKKHKTRIGSGGVTQAVVDMIRERWKSSEIVRLKIEGAAALNMKRMHEILERKTGGLVIWRSGTSLSLYRGVSYEVPKVELNKRIFKKNEISSTSSSTAAEKHIRSPSERGSDNNNNKHAPQENSNSTAERKDREPLPDTKYEDEVDKLLDGLGPRYTDWPGCDPLPVDADMLPAVVPGYQPPFRILPYGVRSNLGAKEATDLRRLARVLPPHFALGRNRHLQGLAVAMIALWEKSLIAKIALKRGVQLTTSERMAEDIKKLTGGMLLSRNKDFLVFYRGKNFLSRDVTEALLERERLAKSLQDGEEQARLRASALVIPRVEIAEQSGTAGTLGETLDADARWGKTLDDRHKEKLMKEAEMIRHANLVRKLERKLTFAERKLIKAERALYKVEESLIPAQQQADPDSITDEERFMFRKLGLRMKAFLLLGRRGVFDGTVENMHLHWKYRELVKILVKAKTFEHVKKIALALEAESGGVLVSVDKVSKGYAILVFRGKEYKRPAMLRPKNLLTKRKALARSIELQRSEALQNHISALRSKVEKLRSEIEQMDVVKDQGDEVFYGKLDSAYSTDDEESEEEGDEASLETYYSEDEDDVDNDSDGSTCNLQSERNFSCDFQNPESETKSEIPEPDGYAVTNSLSNEADEIDQEGNSSTSECA